MVLETPELNVIQQQQVQRARITRPSREASEQRLDETLWLDKNENMDPQYHAVLQNLLVDLPASALFGYPDCHALYQKLAAHLEIPIKQLIVAAGSDGIIRLVYETFIAPGDTVIYTNPTFAMYALYAQMYGAKAHELDYLPSAQGPVLPAHTVIAAILHQQPKLVCLPNPNSPSGTVYTPQELYAIIKTAHATPAVILIDEAYFPFYGHTVLPLIAEFPRLIVARSFSKGWGAAGIRLGYGAAAAPMIEMLHKLRPMYEAGALSLTLAERLLDAEHHAAMLASVARLNTGKQFFLGRMQRLGLPTLAAEGNFLHVAFGAKAPQVHAVLKDHVLYRQDFGHPSLAGFSRFSATTAAVFAPIVTLIESVFNPN